MCLTDIPPGPSSADCVAIDSTSDVLDSVTAPHLALALWRRPAPAIVSAFDLDTVDDLSLVLDALDEGTPAGPALLAAGYPPDTARTLADDLTLLAATHRRLTGAAAIKVRLDVIDTDACRRFHADYVSLRMLCTYRGTGTQWCRTATPETVHTLPTGTVSVFKGRLAMEEPLILHRSPPRCATGAQRLLLVLDPG